MENRLNDKHWEQDGDKYKLLGRLFPYDERDKCLAILQETRDKYQWVWALMDFTHGFKEPMEINVCNMEGPEEIYTLRKAKETVEENLVENLENYIYDLEKVRELFGE